MKKTKNTKELKIFKSKLFFSIFTVDLIVVFITYIIMPIIQGFPPLSENNFIFQNQAEPINHAQQYILVLIVCVTLHFIAFNILMRRIYNYLNKYYRTDKVSYEEIKTIRNDCISIPYKIFITQTAIVLVVGILLNIIMLIEFFTVIKFVLMLVAIISLISIFLLIITQRLLSKVLETTYHLTDVYERNIGTRMKLSQDLMLQMIPFIAVVLIIIALIGNAKTVEKESENSATYYKLLLENLNLLPEQVDPITLKNLLETIPLENEDDYFYILDPNDNIAYISKKDGEISEYLLLYRDFFYDQTQGVVYERPGIPEQSYMLKIKDINGEEWCIGFKFVAMDEDTLLSYFAIIVFMLSLYTILLYIWSKNTSRNLEKITNSLKEIVDGKTDLSHNLPIMSNNEYGDLSYYYNKIQEMTKQNIEQIRASQDTIVEKERLASLGQMIGGIAHNLKTPIMSIAGASEALSDLAKEYNNSIGDAEVTIEDHHEISKEMLEWIDKTRTHLSYMSDVITAIKGQAVAFSDKVSETFTIEEVLKHIDILMRHELNNALIKLNTNLDAPDTTLIKGNINSLVQVANNIISNAIQAYNGKQNENIDLLIYLKDTKLIIEITDYAGGLPDTVKDKLFKEMVTTKGKDGTGLGLFMSYSNIKAHFNGNLSFKTETGKGTTFIIELPL